MATPGSAGWIECSKIDELLSSSLRLVCSIDGSDPSVRGLEFVLQGLMMQDRASIVHIVHLYDDSKDYLPPAWRKEALQQLAEDMCTSWLLPNRYRVNVMAKVRPVGEMLVDQIVGDKADFTILGMYGRKGKKNKMASNVLEVLQRGRCSCIVMQNETRQQLALNRPAKFVISVSLNAASTKAFVDALRLSKPSDEIHVVYVKSYLEHTESDYTIALREKYANLFAGLQDPDAWDSDVPARFGNRDVFFTLLDKRRKETTAHTVVRYADDVDADFVIVGTNTMRVERGKIFLGSVSLQICLETDRNFVVSNYNPTTDLEIEGAAKGRRPSREALNQALNVGSGR